MNWMPIDVNIIRSVLADVLRVVVRNVFGTETVFDVLGRQHAVNPIRVDPLIPSDVNWKRVVPQGLHFVSCQIPVSLIT